MSFSSYLGSGLNPTRSGIIGVTLENGVAIPLNTSGNPVTVINKDIIGIPNGYYLLTYTMVIKCLTNDKPPALLSLQIEAFNNTYFNVLDEYDLEPNEYKEVTITQIANVVFEGININLTYKAGVSISNVSTYEFQGLLAYEPIELIFVPPPI
jgi:hypothetical protein